MRRLHISSPLLCAITLVALAGGYSCGDSPTSPTTNPTGGGGGTVSTADVTITIVGMNGSQSYSPNPATVRAGQTVSWRNADSLTHTATAIGGAFDTGSIGPGSVSAPIRMPNAGTLAYRCTPHPSMTGSLVVQ